MEFGVFRCTKRRHEEKPGEDHKYTLYFEDDKETKLTVKVLENDYELYSPGTLLDLEDIIGQTSLDGKLD